MNIALILFLTIFFVLLILGAPTYLCLLTSGLVYFMFHPEVSPMMFAQKMFSSLNNFVFLAVPMFMLSGSIMNNGNITTRIFNFALKLVGHTRAGLAHVNVFASFIFSGMSGSALADVGGLGQIEIAAMRKEKYDEDLILGVTAASSTMGPIVPPSIPMVVYGAISSTSVGALFLGGFLPGVVMMFVLFASIAVIARKRKYFRHQRSSIKEVFDAFKQGFWALLMPIIVMGGIWVGWVTPTEAAMISIMYVLIILFFVYKDMTLKRLWKTIFETVENIVPALTIVAGSALFGWVLQFERLDQSIIKWLFSITHNRYIIMFILNIMLLGFGMILDATPIILLFVPMFLPLAQAIGVHPVQMGVIVVLNLMIGLMTPPIGQSLFMLSTVTKTNFEHVVKCTAPWLIPLFIALMIVTFIPAVVLWLPSLFGLI